DPGLSLAHLSLPVESGGIISLGRRGNFPVTGAEPDSLRGQEEVGRAEKPEPRRRRRRLRLTLRSLPRTHWRRFHAVMPSRNRGILGPSRFPFKAAAGVSTGFGLRSGFARISRLSS